MRDHERRTLRRCTKCDQWFLNQDPACEECVEDVTAEFPEGFDLFGGMTKADKFLSDNMKKHEAKKKGK